MYRLCHRCHAELPIGNGGPAVGPSSTTDDDAALFCPRCGAPQILLPDYMRTETEAVPAVVTTGTVPPPRPQMIDWPIAIQCAAPVAVVTGVLAVGGLVLPAASFLNTLCVLSGAGVVLGLYRTRRPLARIDARVGYRMGLLTGVLMVAAIGICLATTGLIERFGTHSMAGFDAEVAQQFSLMQVKMAEQAQAQSANGPEALEVQKKMVALLQSPEVRAGLGLFYLSVMATFILLLTTLCGAFSGLLQTRRAGVARARRNGD